MSRQIFRKRSVLVNNIAPLLGRKKPFLICDCGRVYKTERQARKLTNPFIFMGNPEPIKYNLEMRICSCGELVYFGVLKKKMFLKKYFENIKKSCGLF